MIGAMLKKSREARPAEFTVEGVVEANANSDDGAPSEDAQRKASVSVLPSRNKLAAGHEAPLDLSTPVLMPPMAGAGETTTAVPLHSIISLVRTMVQQEFGRAGQASDSPRAMTPPAQDVAAAASSEAAVRPKGAGPATPSTTVGQPPSSAGSTPDVEALQFRPAQWSAPSVLSAPSVSSTVRAPSLPSSVPSSSPCSPSYFPSLSSSASSPASSFSQHSPISPSASSQRINPATATTKTALPSSPASPRAVARAMSSSRLYLGRELPAERRSSVHFDIDTGPNTANASRSRSSSQVPEQTTLSPVDQKWGVLFDGGQATGRFTEVIHSLAKHIVQAGHLVIVPERLVSFYSGFRVTGLVDYRSLFLTPNRDAHEAINRLYLDLGCAFHLVQAHPTMRPHVPALTPDGFARWMALNILAFPDEEASRLGLVVSETPLEGKSALDGKPERLPRQLSRYLLPKKPDGRARELLLRSVRRHFGEGVTKAPATSPQPPLAPPLVLALVPRDDLPPAGRGRRHGMPYPGSTATHAESDRERERVRERDRPRRASISRGSVYEGRVEEEKGSRPARSSQRRDSHSGRDGYYAQSSRRNSGQMSPSERPARTPSRPPSRAASRAPSRAPSPPSQSRRTHSYRHSLAEVHNSGGSGSDGYDSSSRRERDRTERREERRDGRRDDRRDERRERDERHGERRLSGVAAERRRPPEVIPAEAASNNSSRRASVAGDGQETWNDYLRK